MQYKEYGNTGKKISVIGFGGMRFRKQDYTRSLDICAQLVKKANELGINYFDTAPQYCDDKSEDIFGIAFKNMKRDNFYVSTKSIIHDDPTADDVRRRIEKSLRRMNLNKINFFHMWCILSIDQYNKIMSKGGPYEGALKAKEEGLIEHIVASTHCDGDEIEHMVNDNVFEGLTIGYNAINFAFRRKGLEAAYKNGLGVVTMNPLAGGIIPQYPEKFNFIKENDKDTLAQAALKFNISHKEITCALPGISTMQELIDDVKAGETIGKMTEEKLNAMSNNLNTYLDELCTGCNYCMDCPEEIPISKFMDAYNIYMLKDSKNQLKKRLKFRWYLKPKEAAKCIECGKCEDKCTQHLPIIERLKYIANI